MATHSSIFAWRIPKREEPGRLQSRRSQTARHNWVTQHTHVHQSQFPNSSHFPSSWVSICLFSNLFHCLCFASKIIYIIFLDSDSLFFWKKLFFSLINLFTAVLGLHCSAGFYLVAVSGGCSLVVVQTSHCSGFSCCSVQALECFGFSSCGTRA